ncbi:hypothetical protein VJ918_08030 [Adlercreutzia sp. R21]|nr:hypothetical protein [Adlercreutzia sp. R21]MEC4184755.1 hypothetical protein [Adlercreutzia sp. R21]
MASNGKRGDGVCGLSQTCSCGCGCGCGGLAVARDSLAAARERAAAARDQ